MGLDQGKEQHMLQGEQEQVPAAYLVIQRGPKAGKRIELWKESTSVGRSLDSDIFL
jgi:pSer/pThr/pTyr-binding forkhead associated (FHA) protein